MILANILWSAVVAAVVSGILVFTYQQWLQARIRRGEARYGQQLQESIRRLEVKLERERSYEQHSNEMLVSSYRKIWAGLVDIEHWLRRDLPAEVGRHPVLDPEVVFAPYWEAYKGFRAEMLFLPDRLYDRTLKIIMDLEPKTNLLLDALRQAIAARTADPVRWERDPNRMNGVIGALNNLSQSYRDGLDDLRHDYQAISRDLLLGEKIPERLSNTAQVVHKKLRGGEAVDERQGDLAADE